SAGSAATGAVRAGIRRRHPVPFAAARRATPLVRYIGSPRALARLPCDLPAALSHDFGAAHALSLRRGARHLRVGNRASARARHKPDVLREQALPVARVRRLPAFSPPSKIFCPHLLPNQGLSPLPLGRTPPP